MDAAPDPDLPELTPATLAALSADDVGSAVVAHVRRLIAVQPGAEAAVVRALPPGLRAIYTTWLVDAEVNDGGFNRFFFHPCGRYAGDALAGYELLGAEAHAAVMRAAIATYEAEREALAPYHAAGTAAALAASYGHTSLGEVDQRYYALGDHIYNVWAGVVQTRPELFAGSPDAPSAGEAP